MTNNYSTNSKNTKIKTKKLIKNNIIEMLFFKKQFKYLKTYQPYHLVDPSPWPVTGAFAAFMLTTGLVSYMHKFIGGLLLLITGFTLILYVMYLWWRDVIREATFEDQHNIVVQKGLRLGMILFIVSEVMFFFAFFWAFFHSSLTPVHNIGGVWPPKAIATVDTFTIPLTNTFILLSSGATVTWAHHAIVARAKKQTLVALIFTLILSILFTSLQVFEYVNAPFNISDGIYGSCFYMATGFHGFHVILGTIALLCSFIRIIFNHFTDKHHFGFESAIWYWHFVDVVWLFLFLSFYWWGGDVNIEKVYFSFSILTPVPFSGVETISNIIFFSFFIFIISFILKEKDISHLIKEKTKIIYLFILLFLILISFFYNLFIVTVVLLSLFLYYIFFFFNLHYQLNYIQKFLTMNQKIISLIVIILGIIYQKYLLVLYLMYFLLISYLMNNSSDKLSNFKIVQNLKKNQWINKYHRDKEKILKSLVFFLSIILKSIVIGSFFLIFLTKYSFIHSNTMLLFKKQLVVLAFTYIFINFLIDFYILFFCNFTVTSKTLYVAQMGVAAVPVGMGVEFLAETNGVSDPNLITNKFRSSVLNSPTYETCLQMEQEKILKSKLSLNPEALVDKVVEYRYIRPEDPWYYRYIPSRLNSLEFEKPSPVNVIIPENTWNTENLSSTDYWEKLKNEELVSKTKDPQLSNTYKDYKYYTYYKKFSPEKFNSITLENKNLLENSCSHEQLVKLFPSKDQPPMVTGKVELNHTLSPSIFPKKK